ncbi:MAG: citrate synthase [Myxococcales bacterium]|nr:citrate synthase [Myxococcales bacterium]
MSEKLKALTPEEKYSPGFAGIPAAKSAICHIDGEAGILEYRGINVEDLAFNSSFEETCHLLLFGKLPNRAEFSRWTHDLTTHRRLKYKLVDLIKCLPETGHPMDALQAVVAALGMFYPAKDVTNKKENYWSCVRLIAKLPTIVAAFHRLRIGDEDLKPRDDLSASANFLYMLNEKVPSAEQARVLDAALILHAEHSMNASTFAGRVIGSTLADPYRVVASALGALSGPLHGGANQDVIHMLHEIGSVERVEEVIMGRIKRGEKITGFGHRVYKVKDPRAYVLQKLGKEILGTESEDEHTELYAIAEAVEKLVSQELGQKGIYPNVDFYSGVLYMKLGLRADLFTPMFAIARVAGWLAHWLEQLIDNKIYRPNQIYTGSREAPFVPMSKRT